MGKEYNVESYWSEVASRIAARKGSNVVAGDDEPYYRYKREEFLKMLHSIDFESKTILEVGCGPGGNLMEIFKHKPFKLIGVDVSVQMVELAKKYCPTQINILKIDGSKLPFDNNYFDIVLTATVLQHNTNQIILTQLISEICRTCKDTVYFFERIEPIVMGDDLNEGRPISFYSKIMKENGYDLVKSEFINIRVSYYISGLIRKLLNRKNRQEGEPLNNASIRMQKILLPFSRRLDKVLLSKRDVAKLEFRKTNFK